MTKQRPPLSFERALVRIADHLGWAEMGRLIDKAARTVMDYSDHDTPTTILLEDAFTLERAYRAAGGEGAPISDCWRLRLDMAAATADQDELFALVIKASKEGGEAQTALIAALAPGADAVDRRHARRETQEAIEALTQTLPLLSDGDVPDGSRGGDTGGITP